MTVNPARHGPFPGRLEPDGIPPTPPRPAIVLHRPLKPGEGLTTFHVDGGTTTLTHGKLELRT